MRQRGHDVFSMAMRVYWEDTDAAGVVFYANYLKFFERARTEWLRALGFGQEALRRDAGIGFVVSETTLRYRRPARLDDVIDVSVGVVISARRACRSPSRRAGPMNCSLTA
jgi:acyl-CoA thioester hydrolase, YbgC/YbaW family